VIAICLLAKEEEVVCIEEPESNLHPSAQAYLADFLLAMAASGRQIIIETHSPNIIDRIRLRKAHKKSWRKLKDSKWVASSLSMDKYSKVDDEVRHFLEPKINIIFAEQNSEGNSEYRQAILDKNGDIIFDGSSEELWPKGFFDNTQEELSNILKARIYSEEE
jgi:energy-coupling factor transporter ATP-binding protein EcfA2